MDTNVIMKRRITVDSASSIDLQVCMVNSPFYYSQI